MARIGIRGGHTQTSKGAFGYLDEWSEDRILYPLIINYLREVGNEVFDLTPPENLAFPQEMYNATNRCNVLGLDLFASIHFNSSGGDPVGSEVWVYPGTPSTANIGARITSNMNKLGFVNRGVKTNTGFIDLNSPNCPSMIIETCFVQETDGKRYKNIGADKVARYIANGIDSRVSLEGSSKPSVPQQPQQPSSTVSYRVKDVSGKQLGAFVILSNAEKCAKDNKAIIYYMNSKVVANYSQPSKPTPQPPTSSKSKVDVFYKFDNLPWVKNLEDNAGLDGVSAKNLYVYPSPKGEVLFRVARLGGDYYPWVQNYKTSTGRYDFAGNGVAIDRVQMKLRGLDGYRIKYKVKLVDGRVLPWVYDCNDINGDGYAGIRGCAISNIWIEIESR